MNPKHIIWIFDMNRWNVSLGLRLGEDRPPLRLACRNWWFQERSFQRNLKLGQIGSIGIDTLSLTNFQHTIKSIQEPPITGWVSCNCMIYWKIVSTFGGPYISNRSASPSQLRGHPLQRWWHLRCSGMQLPGGWELSFTDLPGLPGHRFLHVFSEGPPLETAVPGPKTKQASKWWGLVQIV